MKERNHQKRRTHPLVMTLAWILVIAAIVMVFFPPAIRQRRKADMVRATSNAKQLYYLMIEFDQDYGQFPGDATAILPSKDPGKPNVDLRSFKGKYSNDYLGQFIAAGYTKSEEIFVAPWEKDRARKADDVISPRERILEAGECGFSYVKNQSTSDNSGRPILLAPMAGDGFAFDPDVYGGKGVVLRIDGAVKQLLIQKDTHRAKVGGGKTIFDDGEDSVWGMEGFDQTRLVHPAPAPDR